jgi:diaminopimelate decarboxylase
MSASRAFSSARLHLLAEKFGTPYYVYDFDVIERQTARLKRALGRRFELAYAIKANPALSVLAFLAKRGLGADVASRGELAAALAAGFPPARLLATGPAKSDADLEALVAAGIGQIHVEGPEEMERLEAIGKRARRRIPIGLRLNPPWGIAETRTIIGGPGAKKFGFDLASARRTLVERERFPHLHVGGFQVFNASNVLDAALLSENVRRVIDLALSLSRSLDVPLRVIDFGGGFGVPYTDAETPLDLARLKSGLDVIARSMADEPRLAGTRLVFEPGRFLVAEAGRYVVRVIGTKRSRGVVYALVDGGIHQLLRPALLGTPHRVRLAASGRPRGASFGEKVVIVGPLCTSLDVLHPAARLPLPRAGDLLSFENAGAYGYTESMPLFLSHEWAAEIGVRKTRAALLRRPPRVSEILEAQTSPF